MFRKIALAFAAATVVAGAALAPTTASAWGGHGWGGGHGGWHGGWRAAPVYRGYGPRFYAPRFASGGCYMQRVVPTPWGPRVRMVNRCY